MCSSDLLPTLSVRLAKSLNKYANTNVDVIGHTDNVGNESYNQELSARRAGSVAAILAQSGVSQSRMRAYGRGELKPTKSNDTANGRAANRRVEIIMTLNG